MKKLRSKITLALLGVALVAAGCMTAKQTTVTPNGSGGFTTNVVTIVNTNNLNMDCSAIQGTVAGVIALVLDKTANPAVLTALHDASTSLDGVLNGANPQTTQEILGLLNKTPDPVLQAQVTPLVDAVSSFEQSLLADPRYGASVAGQIGKAIAAAVQKGISLGLAGR